MSDQLSLQPESGNAFTGVPFAVLHQLRRTNSTSEKYEFFPDDLKAQLPKLYSQEHVKDPIVYVKWFTPWSNWTWYATEGEQQDDQFICFGYVIGQDREWGYFSLTELQSVTGPFGLKVERDIHFTPKPRSEVKEIK